MRYKTVQFAACVLVLLIALLDGGCSMERVETAAAPAAAISATSSDPEISTALKIIEKAPDSSIGYNRLAALYIKRARETGDFGLYSKAETAVARALEVAPDDATARKLKASLHLSYHRFTDALAAGQQLQKEFPDDAFIYGVLSDANVELGNYDEAVNAAQQMIDLRPDTASYARVAQIRLLHGDYPGAVEMMTLAARTADPADKEAQSWCLVQLGDIHWKNGEFEKAEKIYDEALDIFPDYFLALASKGRVRAGRGDLESAARFLSDAQNRVPNIEMIYLLGDVYTRLGDTEKAGQQYNLAEVVEQKLGSAGDRRRLALFWTDNGIRLDEALAIASNEHDARKDIYTADIYAWCLLKNGQAQKAKKIIGEAIRLKTSDARILYHAGMIEQKLGNKKEAARLLKSALEKNSSFDLIQAGNAKQVLTTLKN